MQLKLRREEAKAAAKALTLEETTKVSNYNFLSTSNEINDVLFNQQTTILLVYKELLTTSSNLKLDIPREIELLLQEYRDDLPEDNHVGLSHVRCIKRQIDFIPGATLPNRLSYMTNPLETKEFQKQANDLLEKEHIRKSMSPYVVLVVLVPKKYRS